MTHAELVNDILLAVGSLPSVRCWRRDVGVATVRGRVIRYGIPGEADIDGIIWGGRRLSIEVKVGRDKLSDKQIAWKLMIQKFGGVWLEGRSVAQVLADLQIHL